MNVVGGIADDPVLDADQEYQVVGDAELDGLREFVREVIRRCRTGDDEDGTRVLGRRRPSASMEQRRRAVTAHGG